MAGWSKLAVLLIVCLPACAQVYHVAVPDGVDRVEWSAPGIGWAVDVEYDRETCEIYCTYRRTQDLLGEMPLLPPATTIRFFDGLLETAVAVIDPAGLTAPALDEGTPPDSGDCCLLSKSLLFAPADSRGRIQFHAPRPAPPLPAGLPVVPFLSLRV